MEDSDVVVDAEALSDSLSLLSARPRVRVVRTEMRMFQGKARGRLEISAFAQMKMNAMTSLLEESALNNTSSHTPKKTTAKSNVYSPGYPG